MWLGVEFVYAISNITYEWPEEENVAQERKRRGSVEMKDKWERLLSWNSGEQFSKERDGAAL